MAEVLPVFPAKKRLILPVTFSFTITGGGEDFVEIPFFFTGHITHLVLETTAAMNPKGKVRIEDVDSAGNVFRDPKPGDQDVRLDFYSFEMRIPVNGNYKIHFSSLPTGDYTGIFNLEERPTRV